MGRRRQSRDQKRKNKQRILAYKRNYAQIQYALQKEWLQKLRLLSNIQPPRKNEAKDEGCLVGNTSLMN